MDRRIQVLVLKARTNIKVKEITNMDPNVITRKCCICGKEFTGYGNRPHGAVWRDPQSGEIVFPTFNENDRCCDRCDFDFVIPGRIYRCQVRKDGNK